LLPVVATIPGDEVKINGRMVPFGHKLQVKLHDGSVRQFEELQTCGSPPEYACMQVFEGGLTGEYAYELADSLFCPAAS